jgi:O-antigen ligase
LLGYASTKAMVSEAIRAARVPDSAALTRAVWPGVAVASGLAVGVAATFDWVTAVILAAALALAPLVLFFPPLITPLIVAAVFTEAVNVGGLTISRIIAPLALFVVLVALFRGGYVLRTSAPLGWVCAYSLWALASGLWTVHVDNTLTSLWSLTIALTFMLAFAILLRSRRDLDRVLYTLALMALAVGVIGLFTSQGRAEGASGNANYFAMVEIFALPFVLVLATEARWRVVRVGLYAIVFVIIFSVFASLSRGGFLTLVSVAVAALIWPARSSFFQSRAHKAFVLTLIAVGTFVAFKANSGSLAPRLESVFAEGQSGAGRTNVWRGAWTSIQERPLLGLGYGSFISEANELMLRTPGVDLTKQKRLRPRGLYAHNAYVGTAAELGIPGLMLFVGILISAARALRRTAVRAGAAGATYMMRIANASLISLVALSIAALFASSETSRPIWILIGISLALPKLIEERETARSADVENAQLSTLSEPQE